MNEALQNAYRFSGYLIRLRYIIIGRRSTIHNSKANALAFEDGLTFNAMLEIIDSLRRAIEQAIVIYILQNYFPVTKVQAFLRRSTLPQNPGGNCSSRP